MRFICSIILMLLCVQLNAQAKKCIAISNDGKSIQGVMKSSEGKSGVADGIVLIDASGNEIKILPTSHSDLNFKSQKFHTVEDKMGKKRFMEVLVDGDKAKLYSFSYSVTANVPGEGLSSGWNLDYYMKRGNVTFNVDKTSAWRSPEKYFPGNQALIDKIKSAKKKNIELVLWTLVYNGELSISDLPK